MRHGNPPSVVGVVKVTGHDVGCWSVYEGILTVRKVSKMKQKRIFPTMYGSHEWTWSTCKLVRQSQPSLLVHDRDFMSYVYTRVGTQQHRICDERVSVLPRACTPLCEGRVGRTAWTRRRHTRCSRWIERKRRCQPFDCGCAQIPIPARENECSNEHVCVHAYAYLCVRIHECACLVCVCVCVCMCVCVCVCVCVYVCVCVCIPPNWL